MTYMPWRRAMEQHHARQLRKYPPRLWSIIEQERFGALKLYEAHGRPPAVQPLEIDLRTRIESAA